VEAVGVGASWGASPLHEQLNNDYVIVGACGTCELWPHTGGSP
jgi:hypothetical protein